MMYVVAPTVRPFIKCKTQRGEVKDKGNLAEKVDDRNDLLYKVDFHGQDNRS